VSEAKNKPPKATTKPSDSFLTARLPKDLHDELRVLARHHGRSVSEEVKWAMVIFNAQTTLAELQHPEALAVMGAEAHAAAIAEVKRDLRDYTAAALRPRESRDPVLL
jgi:plasmid stability protein